MAFNSVIKTAFEEVLTMPSDYDDTQPVTLENYSPGGWGQAGLGGRAGGGGIYQRFNSIMLGNLSNWSASIVDPVEGPPGSPGSVGLINNDTNDEYKAMGGWPGDGGGRAGYNGGTITPDVQHVGGPGGARIALNGGEGGKPGTEAGHGEAGRDGAGNEQAGLEIGQGGDGSNGFNAGKAPGGGQLKITYTVV